MSKKRLRSSNFSECEEEMLVENKKTDACTVKEKQCAWEKIAQEFNSLCPNIARNSKALKDKYTNIKTIMRKQFAAEKASRKMTGGGKEMPEWRPRSDAMAELANVIAISIHGTAPCYDDDDAMDSPPQLLAVAPPAVQSHVVESLDVEFESFVEEYLSDSETEPITKNIASTASNENEPIKKNISSTASKESSSTTWATYTPSQLRKPNSAPLKRPMSSQNNSLQNLKRKLIERELEMREIEHQTRMKQQQTEHEARMQLLQAQKQQVENQIKIQTKNKSESEE